MKAFVVVVAVLVLSGAGYYAFVVLPAKQSPGNVQYRTAHVERGEVIEGVAASGTVQPVELIQIGTQISGVIQKLFADFNSKVTAGQTIAILDTRRLDSQVAQDEASVARARADVDRVKVAVLQAKIDIDRIKAVHTQSKADVERVKALLIQAGHELDRQNALVERHLGPQADLDAAIAAKASLEAQLASAEASVAQNVAQIAAAQAAVQANEAQVAVSEASVHQSEAQLEGDKVNLGYATILSPVDGVVVSRSVDVGQTVAASLSAPTLFIVAKDLTKVHVETSVPEADIGKIHEAQHAHFSVDAHPDHSFEGVVSQVRLASTTVQNVVTYTVIIDASNPDGLLLPGMTANVTFEVVRSEKNALKVPATALRLQPTPDLLETPAASEATVADKSDADRTSEKAASPRGPTPGNGASSGGRSSRNGAGGSGAGGGRKRKSAVYVQTPEGRLRAIQVRAGVSDGVFTVVEPEDPAALTESTEVVTAILREEEPATTNPFAPPRMGGPRGAGGGGGR